MSKQKLSVAVVSSLFFFIGGVSLVQAAKPSYCSLPKDTATEYSGVSEDKWQNCCANYDEAKCTGGAVASTSANSSNDGGGETYDSPNSTPDYSTIDAGSGSAYNRGNMDSSVSGSSGVHVDVPQATATYEIDNSSSSGGNLGDLSGLAGTTGLPNPSGGIKGVVDRVLNWALGIFGALALLAFVISGIMYLTAAGDTDQIKKAKTAMIWSIVGVVVGLGGVIVLQTIDYLLR